MSPMESMHFVDALLVDAARRKWSNKSIVLGNMSTHACDVDFLEHRNTVDLPGLVACAVRPAVLRHLVFAQSVILSSSSHPF